MEGVAVLLDPCVRHPVQVGGGAAAVAARRVPPRCGFVSAGRVSGLTLVFSGKLT